MKCSRYFAPLFVLALGVLLLSVGCSKSTTTEVKYDTLHVRDTLLQHDTLSIKEGPEFIRFVAMLNDQTTIVLKTSRASGAPPMTSATSQSSKLFIPIRSDTSLTLYATFFSKLKSVTDSFTLPAFEPQKLISVILFQAPDSSNLLTAVLSDDSSIKIAPPSGYGYVRCINGLPDYPQPTPLVNLVLDSVNGKPIFTDDFTHVATPIAYQEIHSYERVPVGQHIIYVVQAGTSTQLYSSTLSVVQGSDYTAKLSGSKSAGTDRFLIDAE
jgi:hypothetical protein